MFYFITNSILLSFVQSKNGQNRCIFKVTGAYSPGWPKFVLWVIGTQVSNELWGRSGLFSAFWHLTLIFLFHLLPLVLPFFLWLLAHILSFTTCLKVIVWWMWRPRNVCQRGRVLLPGKLCLMYSSLNKRATPNVPGRQLCWWQRFTFDEWLELSQWYLLKFMFTGFSSFSSKKKGQATLPVLCACIAGTPRTKGIFKECIRREIYGIHAETQTWCFDNFNICSADSIQFHRARIWVLADFWLLWL